MTKLKVLTCALGLTVSLCSAFTVLAKGPKPRGVVDMKVGQMVEIEGRLAGPRMINAVELEVMNFPGPPKFEGAIQDIQHDAKSFTALGVKIVGSEETTVEAADGQPLQFPSLQNQQIVEVQGSMSEDGTFSATEVELVDPEDQRGSTHAALEGQIQEIDVPANTLVVLGVKVKISAQTKLQAEK